jgi:N-glycosylase/DNA lyase
MSYMIPPLAYSIDGSDILYVLTISGDLADYYDSHKGEGAWNSLAPDTREKIVRGVQRGLDGYMEDREIAFDSGITHAEEV